MAKDLATFVKEKAQQYGDRIFLKDHGTDHAISYQAFADITDRLAWRFGQLGLKKEDRVALLHPNHSDFILAYFSIIKAGGVAVPINPLYPPPEIEFIINDAQAVMLVTTAELALKVEGIAPKLPSLKQTFIKHERQNLEDVIEAAMVEALGDIDSVETTPRDPDDLAILFYTSGTTGKPKGVMITHRNLTFSGPNVAQNYGLREGDVTVAALPLVHVFANASPVLGSLSSGGTVIVMERFTTEHVFDAIERHGVTWYPGVPTMLHYLLAAFSENSKSVASLRMFLSGGASLAVEALREIEEKFQTEVLEVYGLTESTGLVTANPVYGLRKPGSIGLVVSGVEVKIVDPANRELGPKEIGELIFRGPNAAKGYWNLPKQTDEKMQNGWVHTGDHAYRDNDGYYFIVGRDKELIITGGYNIYPREIEEVLFQHPDVLEAAVIGVEHSEKGQVPKAFVVCKPGSRTEAQAIDLYCKEHLAPYKCPEVSLVGDLPKNPVGKIMKSQLGKTK